MEYVNGRLRPVGGGVLELHVDQGYWWNRPGLKVSHCVHIVNVFQKYSLQ
jgi:putative component of toxin-antitoxin plasmid stabilization module